MNFSESVFRGDEKAIYSLRELYRRHGYTHYRVSKFEEYDLYAHNKSFLISDNVLTFTDINGKLMALKPDITLSIIKNVVADESAVYKLYYDEHVYRTPAGGDSFKEILQTGLERIGNIDVYSECEVVALAAKSLECMSGDYILDISHQRLIEGYLEALGVDPAKAEDFFSLFKSKSPSGIRALCKRLGLAEESAERLCFLCSVYAPLSEGLSLIEHLVEKGKMMDAYSELKSISEAALASGIGDRVYFDPSVVNDMSYYDGIIFKGFINGIPESVLSGGRYDKLLEKLGKKVGALGFAVYLDRLERFGEASDGYDVDVMLVYDEKESPCRVLCAKEELLAKGYSVRVGTAADGSVKSRRILKLEEGGIREIEANG